MTNTELIQKIKAEIERLAKSIETATGEFAEGRRLEQRVILAFLDTLEEETSYDTQKYTPSPSVDIGDVARVQFASHAKVFDKKRKAVFDWEQFKEVAGIFYGFGKKDPTLDDIAEKYAEKLDISKGWFDGSEIDELIKESYKTGYNKAKEDKK